MKASDLILRALEREGVETIFGVPGEENADLMISLLDSPIRFIMNRHEQGSAFQADLYGRLTRKAGVCLSTLGPGATNLVTGVANAHFDRSPVVVITGQASTRRLHKESHQNMDAVSLFAPITKWSTSVRRAEILPEVIRKAFKLAVTEKPGAVHIELPEDIAREETDAEPLPVPPMELRRPAPDDKAVERTVEILRSAKKPIVLAGNGCIRRRASKQLKRFVERTGVMVTHTFMGKGAIDDRDNHSLFTAGLGSRDHVTEAFEKADVVICIGYDMIEWHPERWNRGMDKKIIHIDFEPAEVDAHYSCDVEIVSDIASALARINDRIGEETRFDYPLLGHIRDHLVHELGFPELARAPHDDIDHDAAAKACSAAFPMKPQRILRDLRSIMDEQDILISDVGAHKMWIARHYPVYAPNTCIISNGFASMGIALPGAISAQMIYPDHRVVGLSGDGGFMMNVQELATAVQYGVPCVILVWEDGGYGLIEWNQQIHFGRSNQVRFQNPDLVELAAAFGARSFRVDSADRFAETMREAFAEREKPSVVVVPVDYSENRELSERLGRLSDH